MRHSKQTRAAACIVTLTICFLLGSAYAFGRNLADDSASSDNPPGRVARISYLKGKVYFLPAGQDQWSEATSNFVVTTGDRLYTDTDGRAELEVGPYTVRMAEGTDLTVTNLNDEITQLGLTQGTIRVSVYRIPSGNTVEIDTPNGAVNVLKSGKYRVDVEPSSDRTLVSVFKGSLEISGGGVSQTLESGQAAVVTGQDPIDVESVDLPPEDSFDKWSDERDERLTRASSYVSPFIPGYIDLDFYGHWAMVADYGPVWYPPVPVGWVPYRFGHWAWIDPWGWTWIEDEVWGFCPFHYGRWVLIGGVWGWLPGPLEVIPIYAPALVAFLGGPGLSIGVGVDLVAWFPLGPVDPFFPWYHYGGNYLIQVNVTNVRNTTNITNIINTTNVNDIHYAYRNVATTAVPKDVFSNGEPVTHHVIRLTPEQLAKAQVTPHPAVNPTPRAASPGKLVPRPPVRNTPLPAKEKIAHLKPTEPSAQNRHPAPPSSRVPPPPSTNREAGASVHPAPGEPPHPLSSRVIVRTPPPPPVVPFPERRAAMVDHPGRPLEPPQLENLRVGRPVGPMSDREFPPHPVPVVRERPAMEVPTPARSAPVEARPPKPPH